MLVFSSWAAQLLGTLTLTPPHVIQPTLPCFPPLPRSWNELAHRQEVNHILHSCETSYWPNQAGYPEQAASFQPTLDTTQELQSPSIFTYGEVTVVGARQLFWHMRLLQASASHPDSDVQFLDMGSGVGKLVVQAYMEVPHIVHSSGIELMKKRNSEAVLAWEKLQLVIESPQKQIQFINGDLLQAHISQTTHIFVSSLCFPSELLSQLEDKICGNDHDGDSCPNLECVASLRPFPNQLRHKFEEPYIAYIEMSWTKSIWQGAPTWIYHRSR